MIVLDELELVSGPKVSEVKVSSSFLFEPRVSQPAPMPNELKVSRGVLEEAELIADSLTWVMFERVSI